MLNFTVGPVQSSEEICGIGAEQVPYFRTSEFSELMLENEQIMKKLAKAKDDSRVVFLTGSGTASMEAAIINTLTSKDKVLIVNGGSFGARFVSLCDIHCINHTDITLEIGKKLNASDLEPYEDKGYTAFVVNVHETSTGVHYDMELISEFCKRNSLFLVVDAISSFLADDFDMKEYGVDVMLTGSQKALACPPGVSILVLSSVAISRINSNNPGCMYLDLRAALKDGERGQTPFTPAVGILRQINARLKQIEHDGGVETEKAKIADIAEDFRSKLKDLPFEIASESLSNAVTPLHPVTASANDIFLILKDEYDIWVCPNGGELRDKIFRVGHIGNITKDNNKSLIAAFIDMKKRGLI